MMRGRNLSSRDLIIDTIGKYCMNSRLLTKKVAAVFVLQFITRLAMSMQSTIDGLIAAHALGEKAYAAICLCTVVSHISFVAKNLLIQGFGYVFPGIISQNDEEMKNKALSAMVVLSRVCVIAAFLGQLLFALLYFRTLDIDQETRMMVFWYFVPIIFGLSINVLGLEAKIRLSAVGKVKICSTLGIVESVINVVLDLLFMVVFHMGTFGAGLATAIAITIATIAARIIARKEDALQYKKVPCFDMVRKLIASGLTPAGEKLVYIALTAAVNAVLLKIAGYQAVVVFSVCMFGYDLANNLGSAFYDIMGKFAGFYKTIRNITGSQLLIKVCLEGSLIVSTVLLIIFNVFPNLLFRFYGFGDISERYLLFYRLLIAFAAIELFSMVFSEYFAGILQNRFIFILKVIVKSLLMACGILTAAKVNSIEVIAAAYAATSLIILIVLMFRFAANYKNEKRLRDNRKGITASLSFTAEEGVNVSELLFNVLKNNPQIMDNSTANVNRIVYRVSLIVEEYMEMILAANGKPGTDIDVVLDICGDSVFLYFMDDGKPIRISGETDDSAEISNRFMLDKISNKCFVTQFFELNFVTFDISLTEQANTVFPT